MSKTSVTKGKRGENEFARLLREERLTTRRTAPLQSARTNDAADVQIDEFPHLHVEVKRDERMSVDAMCRQAEEDAAPVGHTPVVAWRRNNGPWRVVLPLSYWLELLEESLELEQVISG